MSTPLQPAAVYLFLNWVRVRTHYSIIDPVIFLCCCLVCDKVDGQVWLSEFCDDLFVNHCQLLYRSSKLCCGNQCRLTTLLSKINVSWNNKVVLLHLMKTVRNYWITYFTIIHYHVIIAYKLTVSLTTFTNLKQLVIQPHVWLLEHCNHD